MRVTTDQVSEWLMRVKLRGSMSYSHRLLSDEERAGIAAVIVPEINRLLEQQESEA